MSFRLRVADLALLRSYSLEVDMSNVHITQDLLSLAMFSPTMHSLYSFYADPSNTGTLTLTYTTRPVPTPTTGQVLIKLRAAGINPSDAANALRDRFKGVKPIIPGRDFAGTIVDAPDDPSLVGSAVFGSSGNLLSGRVDGTHAEYVIVPADAYAPKPSSLSWTHAGAAGTPYATAWLAVTKADICPGKDVVLVLAATGSVGKAATNIVRGLGCRVITASRHDDTDVNTETDRELSKVVELTKEKGVDVVIDTSGATELMERAMNVLSKHGRYGFISAGRGSPELHINAAQMYRRSQTLLGVNSGLVTIQQTAEMMRQMGKMWEEGKMEPPSEEGLEEVTLDKGVAVYEDTMKFSGKKCVFVFDG
jgi:NADPH2:quinone reductase